MLLLQLIIFLFLKKDLPKTANFIMTRGLILIVYVVLFGVFAQDVNAGPVAYAACMAECNLTCSAFLHPFAVAACCAGCAGVCTPALLAPTP